MLRYKLCLLAAALAIALPNIVSAENADADYIAQQYFRADARRDAFLDILKINPTLSDSFLYEVQKRFVSLRLNNGARIGGYKGGFVPRAPIGGVLFADGIINGQPLIKRSDFHTLLVEAEIGFRLCGTRTAAFASVDELKIATCAVFPAIELPDAAFDDLAALRTDFARLRRILIGTNMGASHVLVGADKSPQSLDLDHLDVTVTYNGKAIGLRNGRESEDDVWARLLWTINDFVIAKGYTLSADHVLIPGALTGLHLGNPGDYRVDYGPLGTVEFSVE